MGNGNERCSSKDSDCTGIMGKPSLLKIYGTINNTWLPVLLDSGAEISFISKQFFEKLNCIAKIKPIKYSFTGIDKINHETLGVADLKLKCGNFSVTYRVSICENLLANIVLGANFPSDLDFH